MPATGCKSDFVAFVETSPKPLVTFPRPSDRERCGLLSLPLEAYDFHLTSVARTTRLLAMHLTGFDL